MRQVLAGARLFTGERWLEAHAVVLEDGRIRAVVPAAEVPPDAEVEHLPAEALLVPGFLDVQVNGAGGRLFNDEPTAEAALAIAAALRPSGTTGLLPTLITDERARMEQAGEAAAAAMAHPTGGVLGLHLEGPFISHERRGVHEARHIRVPDEGDLASLVALTRSLAGQGGRLLLTLAPEAVEDTTLRRLAGEGVVLSVGHTTATFERTQQALAAGVRGFTHLFNAMPPLLNREPGPAGAALESSDAWCGIIADGVHVHPALLRVLLRARPPGKVLLVTDAMPPVGTAATSFTLYGRTISRRDGRLTTGDGTLAGADVDMVTCVRNCVHMLGVSVEEALRMASLYPAAFLGLDDRLGRVAAGYRADLTLLAPDLSVLATWVGGAGRWH